jgi:hypothetical protein
MYHFNLTLFMKKQLNPYLTALMMGSLLFASTSCKDDEPEPVPVEEQELITTMTLTLVPEGKGQNVTATFSDPDGPGGNPPATPQTLNLVPNTTYNVTVTLSDDSKTPPVDITAEIKEEGDEHEIFYQAIEGLDLASIEKNDADDMDSNNRPIGLKATITTGEEASSGKLRVTLKHQPDGLKGSTSDITKGETDVEADFPVVVQF